MKKLHFKTEVYDVGNGYRVEVVITTDFYEAWFWHTDCDVKVLLLKTSKWHDYDTDFMCMVKGAVQGVIEKEKNSMSMDEHG